MTSEMDITIGKESDMTITISEELWVELGDSIKESIDYYYK